MRNEFYEDGKRLPELHPDATINHELTVAALCANLDTARKALAGALEMNVVTPAAVAMKRQVRWALQETSPEHIGEQHPNCG